MCFHPHVFISCAALPGSDRGTGRIGDCWWRIMGEERWSIRTTTYCSSCPFSALKPRTESPESLLNRCRVVFFNLNEPLKTQQGNFLCARGYALAHTEDSVCRCVSLLQQASGVISGSPLDSVELVNASSLLEWEVSPRRAQTHTPDQ